MRVFCTSGAAVRKVWQPRKIPSYMWHQDQVQDLFERWSLFFRVNCCVCPSALATSVVCVWRARASEWYKFSPRYSLLIESFVESTTVNPILVLGLLCEEHTGGRVKIYRKPSLPWLQVYSGLAHRKRSSRQGENGLIGKDHPDNWYATLSTNYTPFLLYLYPRIYYEFFQVHFIKIPEVLHVCTGNVCAHQNVITPTTCSPWG